MSLMVTFKPVATSQELRETNIWLTQHEDEVIEIEYTGNGQIMIVYSEVTHQERQTPLVTRRIRV